MDRKLKSAIVLTAMRVNPILTPRVWRWWAYKLLISVNETEVKKAVFSAALDAGSWNIPASIVNAEKVLRYFNPDMPKLIGSNRSQANDCGGRLHFFLSEVANNYFGDREMKMGVLEKAWEAMYGEGYQEVLTSVNVKLVIDDHIDHFMNKDIGIEEYTAVIIDNSEISIDKAKTLLDGEIRVIHEATTFAIHTQFQKVLEVYQREKGNLTFPLAQRVMEWRNYWSRYPRSES